MPQGKASAKASAKNRRRRERKRKQKEQELDDYLSAQWHIALYIQKLWRAKRSNMFRTERELHLTKEKLEEKERKLLHIMQQLEENERKLLHSRINRERYAWHSERRLAHLTEQLNMTVAARDLTKNQLSRQLQK